MIKTYLYDDETKEMVTNLDLGDVHEKLRNPDNLLWIDLYDVHGQELAQIAKLFDFHPLRYNEESDDEITTLELNAFVGSNYVVTIHKHKMGWLRKMDAVCSRYPKFMNRGADFLLYALIDGITDEYFPILDRIDMRIDELEDEIYNKEVRGVTEEFLALKR